MVILVVRCTVRLGMVSEFETAVRAFISQVRANEPDCLVFQASRSIQTANLYLLYEQYTDQDALEFHRQTAYFKEFSQNLLPTLLDLRERELMDWVAG